MKITKEAAEQVLKAVQQSDARGLGLRIAAKRMGDGGIDYAMGFDETHEADTVLEKHGVKLLIAPTSADLLDQVTMDYVRLDSGEMEFVFHNPMDPNYIAPKTEE